MLNYNYEHTEKTFEVIYQSLYKTSKLTYKSFVGGKKEDKFVSISIYGAVVKMPLKVNLKPYSEFTFITIDGILLDIPFAAFQEIKLVDPYALNYHNDQLYYFFKAVSIKKKQNLLFLDFMKIKEEYHNLDEKMKNKWNSYIHKMKSKMNERCDVGKNIYNKYHKAFNFINDDHFQINYNDQYLSFLFKTYIKKDVDIVLSNYVMKINDEEIEAVADDDDIAQFVDKTFNTLTLNNNISIDNINKFNNFSNDLIRIAILKDIDINNDNNIYSYLEIKVFFNKYAYHQKDIEEIYSIIDKVFSF